VAVLATWHATLPCDGSASSQEPWGMTPRGDGGVRRNAREAERKRRAEAQSGRAERRAAPQP
jgi:hypothetical protein